MIRQLKEENEKLKKMLEGKGGNIEEVDDEEDEKRRAEEEEAFRKR